MLENKQEQKLTMEKKGFLGFINSLKWQDICLLAIIVLYTFFQTNLMAGFKQLPGPIYGGDYYYSLGSVQHVLNGGNPFAGSNVLNSEPGYLPLYPIMVSIIGWTFSLTAFIAMKYFSIIVMTISLILFYLFAGYLLKNKSVALISTIIYLPMIRFPVFKYTPFTQVMVFPAFFFSVAWFYNRRDALSAAVVGIMLGLLGISHTIFFVGAVIFMAAFSIYLLFLEHLNKKDKKTAFDFEEFKSQLGKKLLLLAIIAAIGIVIAMLFWWKPIFVYHGELPPTSVVTRSFAGFNLGTKYFLDFLKNDLFNFYTTFDSIRTILFIIGVAGLFIQKKYDSSKKYLMLLLIISFIVALHLYVTQPLLGTHFAADQMRYFFFTLTGALFAGFGALTLGSFLKKYKTYAFILLLAALLLVSILSFNNYTKNDRWMNAGRQELAPNLAAMQAWVLANTKVNDVFLSTNELSFALNGLTGRKEVNGRRAHNSMFLDSNVRHAAAAIMIYGNNTESRKALLKEYQVKYVYWDYYWIQSDFQFDQNGKFTNWFDPLMILATPEYLTMMQLNGVPYTIQKTWFDPTIQGDDMKQEDAIIVLPTQFNMTHPWNPGLDDYIEEVWSYTNPSGVILSKIYRIINVG